MKIFTSRDEKKSSSKKIQLPLIIFKSRKKLLREDIKLKTFKLGHPHKIHILDWDAPIFSQPGRLNKF